MPAPVPLEKPASIVLYDGLCGFCDATVQWTLRHDPVGAYQFAPLQGDTARAIRARHPELPGEVDSIVLVEPGPAGERLYWYSEAIFRICRRLPGPARHLARFDVVPRFLTDLGYRLFARLRFLVWGRRQSCRIPTVEECARFRP